MPKNSLLYRSLSHYRFGMKLLYLGRYEQRFDPVINAIRGNSVVELCFGDHLIASACRKKGISWIGIDLLPAFVNAAIAKGFDARLGDLHELRQFPTADTFIICGSLYHFHDELPALLQSIFEHTSCLLISEPVVNLSQSNGFIGKLAKESATVNGKKQTFRYDENSLLHELKSIGSTIGVRIKVIDRNKKDLILLLEK